MRGKLKNLGGLFFGLLFMSPFVVHAATTPVYDGENNVFYANGTAITISDVDGTTVISWGEDGLQEVPETVTVYGGGQAGTSFDSSSITLNSGTVASIYGGGKGSKTVSADVNDVSIVINGGTVAAYKNGSSKVGGSVYGGGSLAATTGTVNIEIKGGIVGVVSGGGRATVNSDAVGDKSAPENSPNSTTNATINISAGTINDATLGYGLVYGGGQGYSYVKETTVNISGNASLDNAWVIGGGANGRTDDATINISGGTIGTVQTINRGSMINATVNVTGGTIATLYAGGEDPESFDNDVVNGGFLGNILIDITDGTVTNLLPGSNYDKEIEANADYLMIFANPDSIGNVDTLDAAFGTSAKPYVTDGENTFVFDMTDSNVTLDENLFSALKETGNIFTITATDVAGQEALYAWAFDGAAITDPTIEVNTEITFTDVAADRVKEELSSKVTDLENVMYLNFAHHGELPGEAAISYYVGDVYEPGTKLYVTHFNEETKELENPTEVEVDEDGLVTFTITECSTYVISTNAPVASTLPANPATGDNIMFVVGLLLIGLAGIVISKKFIKA